MKASFQTKTATLILILLAFGGLGTYLLMSQLGPWDQWIFGDDGDGFFCLWVMRRNLDMLAAGQFSDFFNARIFYPQTHMTLFWSEVLFFQSALYALGLFISPEPFVAYNITILLLTVLGYLVYFLFFKTIYDLSSKEHGSSSS